MSASIDYIKAKTKFNEILDGYVGKGSDQALGKIYKAFGAAQKSMFGFEVHINQNEDHPYAPYPSVVIYEVDRINKDWCHAIHLDEQGGLTISKLDPDVSQTQFIKSVMQEHAYDEAMHNGCDF